MTTAITLLLLSVTAAVLATTALVQLKMYRLLRRRLDDLEWRLSLLQTAICKAVEE